MSRLGPAPTSLISSSSPLISFTVILLLWLSQLQQVCGGFCYSCAGNLLILTKPANILLSLGTCHSSHQCNCQMGSCEADFCFIEKKPTELPAVFRITKGCVKKPARSKSNLIGCDYDHYSNHVQCICRGDFCNDAILLRAIPRRNITCRECSERQPDCDRTCQGQWCHEVAGTGKSGCGFGPPSLPYFYRGPELLMHRSKTCITISRGNGAPHKYCICNTHLCNDFSRTNALPYYLGMGHKSRSISSSHHRYADMYDCINCDLTAEENALTSNCKQNKCLGHFCVYATQRIFSNSATSGQRLMSGQQNSPIIHVKQGCINVTDSSQIQLGCNHKWMNNEEEELYCACAGDNCNENLATVSASRSSPLWQGYPHLLTAFILACSVPSIVPLMF